MLAAVLHPQSCGVVATAHMVLFFANKKKETCDMDAAAVPWRRCAVPGTGSWRSGRMIRKSLLAMPNNHAPRLLCRKRENVRWTGNQT